MGRRLEFEHVRVAARVGLVMQCELVVVVLSAANYEIS